MVWTQTCASLEGSGRREGDNVTWRTFLSRAVMVAVCYLADPASGLAHDWQDVVGDMYPEEVESVISDLETGLREPFPEGWAMSEESADDTYLLVIEAASATGQTGLITAFHERVLMTFDALRLGVIDAGGAYLDPEAQDDWSEYLRPADAVAVLPFLERIDAWRSNFGGSDK